MTRQQLAVLLERAEAWPAEAQKELVRVAIEIERRHMGVYRLNDEERADVREGLAEIKRGEVASEDEVKAVFDRLRGT